MYLDALIERILDTIRRQIQDVGRWNIPPHTVTQLPDGFYCIVKLRDAVPKIVHAMLRPQGCQTELLARIAALLCLAAACQEPEVPPYAYAELSHFTHSNALEPRQDLHGAIQ